MLHLPHLGSWMNDMWQKKIQWFRLKINKTSVFLIKKMRSNTRLLFLFSLPHYQLIKIFITSLTINDTDLISHYLVKQQNKLH